MICPPAVDLATALHSVKGSEVMVGAQNMHFAEEGAFTGEISASMLVALGVTHVILGHSERRQYFGETDETVNKKLVTALKHHLVPIVCIGEHEQQRESGMTEEILCRRSAARSSRSMPASCIRWSSRMSRSGRLGRGRRLRPLSPREAHLIIRSEVARMVGRPIADAMRILYGGSVKPENAEALLSQPEIDGALVGGASLDPHSFSAIVKAGAAG